MIEWVLIFALETEKGSEIHQSIIPGFKTEKSCNEAGARISEVATDQFSGLKGSFGKTRRVQGNIRCVSITRD